MKVMKRRDIDSSSCQRGTTFSKGILASITIGDVHGMMEAQTERVLSGCWKVWSIMNSPIINGMVTGIVN